MIASLPVHRLCLAAVILVAASLPSCSGSSKPAPKISAVPQQQALGGVAFTIDLAPFVTAPTGQTVTYSVLSGGGSFTGSTYSQLFATVGTKSIRIRASATDGIADTTITVVVVTAEEAVLQAGSGLVLLDRGSIGVTTAIASGEIYTDHFIPVSNPPGGTDAFKAAVNRGHVIFERTLSGQQDLYVFDPNSPATVRLGTGQIGTTDEKYEGKTSDNRVVFTSGVPTDPNLYIYSVETGVTRTISAIANVFEFNSLVDSSDLVYFERGPSAKRDIYVYDPSSDILASVSTNNANELLQGVVPGGGVVFSRDNGAGDIDLWYHSPTVGLTQVAADVGAAGFQSRTQTFAGASPNGMVVFSDTVTATDVDLYYWNPTTLTTTTVALNVGVLDLFHGVTSNNKIIYTNEFSVADWDVHAYTIGGVDADLSATGAMDVFQAITSLDDIVILRAGTDLQVWDDSAIGLVAVDSGAAIKFHGELPTTGNVVFTKTGTGLRRWESTGGVATVSVTGVFAGLLDDGNFVVSVDVAAQDDMYFWNEATDSLTTVSIDARDEKYVVNTTSSGAFVFSRRSVGGDYELYVWDAVNGVRAISVTGLTHTLAGRYSLDNR